MRNVFLFYNPPGSAETILSGTVFFWSGSKPGVNAVTMSLSGAETQTAYTDTSGQYSFTVTASGVFTITPKKHNHTNVSASLVINGVTTADGTRIQDHNSNVLPFDTIYQYIASDINGSNTITTVDSNLANAAAGGNPTAITQIRNRGNWRFVQTAYTQSSLPPVWSFPISHSVNVSSSVAGLDFYAIKVADPDGTADTSIP